MLDTCTQATFTPHLRTTFSLHLAATSGPDVELIAVESWHPQDPEIVEAPRYRVPFSLIFRGPRTPVLPQCIYTLAHAQLGTFDLFLVPIGPDADGMRYEAVFG